MCVCVCGCVLHDVSSHILVPHQWYFMVSNEMCHDGSCVMIDQMRFHGGFSGCYSLVLHPLVVGGCGLGVQAAKAFGGLDAGRAEHSE